MKYATIVCPACQGAWTVETRHESASCPRCRQKVRLAERKPIWHGDDVAGAHAALAMHAGGPDAVNQVSARPRPAALLPHDSATLAAASRANGIVNRSEKAEAVARALTETGLAGHTDLLRALGEAGLDEDRAVLEVARMLATDFLMEPRPGRYRLVDA